MLSVIDYDTLFMTSANAKVIPCGETASLSKNVAKEHLQGLFQDGSRELNWFASCEEGHLVGNYYEGFLCPKCKTLVKTNFAEELEFRGWLEIPERITNFNAIPTPGTNPDIVTPRGDVVDIIPPVLNPRVYRVLNAWLGQCKFVSILESLLNPELELPPKLQGVLGQGYTWFYQNFDDVMRFFLKDYAPTAKRADGIEDFLTINRAILFTRHLPVLNNALHVLTSSGSMQYCDASAEFILQSKIELNSLIFMYQQGNVNRAFVDQRLWDMYEPYLQYADTIEENKLLGKPGHIRKNILGARLHCSFRAVIVPQIEIAMADELHLPWLVGVVGLHHEIINYLTKRHGMRLFEAYEHYNRALSQYDELIDKVMQQLIADCVYKGLPVLFGRNPTLQLGAIQLFFVTKIKTNYYDFTVSVCPIVFSASNADLTNITNV